MKREQLLRLLRSEAKELGLDFELNKGAGKGSPYAFELEDTSAPSKAVI
jgi:hypothetical protein